MAIYTTPKNKLQTLFQVINLGCRNDQENLSQRGERRPAGRLLNLQRVGEVAAASGGRLPFLIRCNITQKSMISIVLIGLLPTGATRVVVLVQPGGAEAVFEQIAAAGLY